MLGHHVFHVVETVFLADEELRRAQRALCKHLLAKGAVRNLDDLIVADELHLMLADHRSAADGVDADFVVRAALVLLMAAKDELFILR